MEIEIQTNDTAQYLKYLGPTTRNDYVACEIAGMTRAERAAERDVAPATVSSNIRQAKKRLQELSEQ